METKKAHYILRISVENAVSAAKCTQDKSTQGHLAVCKFCFTLTAIACAYENLAYSFWLTTGYNTMVAFLAIVSGAKGYAFICIHRHYQLLEGWACCVQQLLTNIMYYLVLRNGWKDLG